MTSLGKILQVKVGKSNVNPQANRDVSGARILFKPKRTNGEKVGLEKNGCHLIVEQSISSTT